MYMDITLFNKQTFNMWVYFTGRQYFHYVNIFFLNASATKTQMLDRIDVAIMNVSGDISHTVKLVQ